MRHFTKYEDAAKCHEERGGYILMLGYADLCVCYHEDAVEMLAMHGETTQREAGRWLSATDAYIISTAAYRDEMHAAGNAPETWYGV